MEGAHSMLHQFTDRLLLMLLMSRIFKVYLTFKFLDIKIENFCREVQFHFFKKMFACVYE